MTNPTQSKPNPNPNPVPAILLYGTRSGPAMTQASWFRAEDKEAVKAAAKELKFSVIELHTDADRALAAGAHEGVLKGSGRMVVGSVSGEVYRRIEEHARQGATPPTAGRRRTLPQSRTNPCQNKSWTSALRVRTRRDARVPPRLRRRPPSKTVPPPAKPCGSARGSWPPIGNEKREFDGFWLAIVKRIDHDEFTLEWFDAPEYPAFKCRPQNIAIPHPEFRLSGK